MTRLWDKGAPLDRRVLEFTAGEDHALDDRLVAYDVLASIAHAEALHGCGVLSAADRDAIRDTLREIGAAHARGDWRVTLELEDGQTALETRLTEKLGATGGRLHAGRSRNDQVLVALRLYLRDAVKDLAQGAEGVAQALDRLSEGQGTIALPGYTHMQQAMPSSVALWAGGYAAEIRDDAQGLRHTMRRIGKNPLGSAAGYGTPNLDIDREITRAALGFAEIHEPVTAVQLSRGKAEAGVLFEIALLMQDLGRLASDVLLFYTREFGFVTLPEAYTTGSSIMPQKRNPDVFELVRGRSATAQACLAEVLGNHDQAAIWVSTRPAAHQGAALPRDRPVPGVSRRDGGCDRGTALCTERIRLDADIDAAAEANALVVAEGIPFREAYRRVAIKRR